MSFPATRFIVASILLQALNKLKNLNKLLKLKLLYQNIKTTIK